MDTAPFLKAFVDAYNKNESFRNSLVGALLCCLCVKDNEHRNSQFPVMVMNFYIALGAASRKTFDFGSAIFLGPGLQTTQCKNAKTRIPPFIQCRRENVLSLLETTLKKIADTSSIIAITLSFDGTKVPKTLSLSKTFKAIDGGVSSNHFLSVEGQSEDWMKSKLDPNSTIEWKDEIKVAVFSIQCPRRGNHVSLLCLANYN